MNSILDTPESKERWAMYESSLQAGLPIVSRETCAIICAMLLVWGNDERFTHHHRLVCELQYAQKRFHIEGSESPDAEFAALLIKAWNAYITGRTMKQIRFNQEIEDYPKFILKSK